MRRNISMIDIMKLPFSAYISVSEWHGGLHDTNERLEAPARIVILGNVLNDCEDICHKFIPSDRSILQTGGISE